MRLSLALAVTMTIALIPFLLLQAEAAPSYKGKVLGVVISKSCQLSPNCVQYNDIIQYDNSNPKFSGGFIPDTKTGDIKRDSPKYKNQLGYYYTDKTFRVIIDPPVAIKGQIQLITILPQLEQYHTEAQKVVKEIKPTNETKATQKVREWSTQRYVDPNCSHGIISGKNWQVLLPDTINYMKNDCQESYTKITTISKEITPIKKHDIGTSAKAKLDKYYTMILKECIKARNLCTDITNPAVTIPGDAK